MALALIQNPDQLFPENVLSEFEKQEKWRVAHTKSRREKALARFLYKEGIGYYLPMFYRRQPNKSRVRFSLAPVFNGYLFFKATDLQRYQALKSNHIANVIEVKDQAKFVCELQQIRRVISQDIPLFPFDFLNQGQEVVVRKGPLKGIQGKIVKKKSQYRLVLKVSYIDQAVALDIDAALVEPVQWNL